MSQKKLIIGLTGGMGSGKSTVLALLRQAGAQVSDSDAIVRELLQPGSPCFKRVIRLLGRKVLDQRGRLDRKVVAQRVFRNPALRRRLEQILHPEVRKRNRARIKALKRGVLVLDIPLLFEAGLRSFVERVLVIWAPQRVRLERLVGRGFSQAEARRRFKAQWPLRKKRRLADYVVDNGGAKSKTRFQVRALWKEWQRELRQN